MTVVSAILAAWLCWVAINMLLLIASPWLAPASIGAFTNGLRIVIPDELRAKLSEPELAAVIAHEHGHIAHRHALANLASRCLLLPRPPHLAYRQELEADDYAAARGHAAALASVVERLGATPLDRFRAARLRR